MGSEAGRVLAGRAIVAGEASGTALVLDHGLSFAMGFEVTDGSITDIHASATGERLPGRILVMPSGRGSSSASTSLAEAIRLGTAPAAIILAEVDQILAIGAMVARTLYDRICPIVVADPADFESLQTGMLLAIGVDGTISIYVSWKERLARP